MIASANSCENRPTPGARKPRLSRLAAAALLLTAVSATHSLAQNYPSRPIRVVVSASVSTPPDIISRIIINEVTVQKGWNFVIENKVGAAQTVAGMDVKRAPADGYSIWLMGMVAATAPALMPQVNLSIARDFLPVIQLARSNNVPRGASRHSRKDARRTGRRDQEPARQDELRIRAASAHRRISSARYSAPRKASMSRMFPICSFLRPSRICLPTGRSLDS